MRKFSFSNKKEGTFNIAKAISCLAIACTVSLTPAYAQQITVDGNTDTALNINNNTTHVYTNTVKGQNAFNSFAKFNVNQGKTVNLVVPDSANNLINIVKSEKTNINGVFKRYERESRWW